MTQELELDGCSWRCRGGRHTEVYGECAFAAKVCEHPVEAIGWASDSSEIVCGECLEDLSIERLAEEARVGTSTGCTCWEDECTKRCGAGRPLSWTLDPAKVLRILFIQG